MAMRHGNALGRMVAFALALCGHAPAHAQGALVITLSSAETSRASRDEAPGPAVLTIGPTEGNVGAPVRFTRAIVSGPPAPPPAGEPRQAVSLGGQAPVNGVLTSRFGMRRHPILGGLRAHSGVDLAAPYGAPVQATGEGVVTRAEWQGGYGLVVDVDNGAGVETRFGHLSRVNVRVGQRLRKGEVLGFVGSTGLSTGPHVHYEVRVDGRAVDPLRK